MYKERKTSSKVCQDRWDEHVKKIHADKLKNMKASVDNKAPKAQKHLENRRKSDQIKEDRLATIEKHNLILLDRMMDIMKKPTQLDNRSTSPVKSLNREARKKELQRINEDNQMILKKLTTAKAYYDRKDWESFEEKQETFLKNICEYPVVKTMEPKNTLPQIHSHPRSYSSPERSPKPATKKSAHRFTPTPTNNTYSEEKKYFSDDDSLSLSDLDSDGDEILEPKEKPKKANGKKKAQRQAGSDSESLGSDFSDSFENDSDKEDWESTPAESKSGGSSKPTSAKGKLDSARSASGKLDSSSSALDSASSGKLDSARSSSGKLDSARSKEKDDKLESDGKKNYDDDDDFELDDD